MGNGCQVINGFTSDSPKMTIESIDELLDLIGSMKKLVVVFDEFQDITCIPENEKVLATFRSKIQNHQDIPYIFAGSIRNTMVDLFTDYQSPFYKTAICTYVDPINREIFEKFIERRFKKQAIEKYPKS